MARVSAAAKSGGTSRFRLVVLEAEVNEGDLPQLTQAIQNALRPNPIIQHRTIAPPPVLNNGGLAPDTAAGLEEPTEEEDVESSQPSSVEPRRPVREPRQRKFRSPKVINVDLKSEPAFKAYALQKNPSSDFDRYLTVACWFKHHRELDEITADHVYTCYREVGWSTKIDDFSKPLRSLKFRQLMDNPSRGNYAINHLGVSRVDELPGK